jgi:putative DNA primase/helicase
MDGSRQSVDRSPISEKEACSHPYGLKKAADGRLIVPVSDTRRSILHGLQFIGGEGQKRFLPGTTKKGHFHLIGKPNRIIFIAEGYATAASIHQATGKAVVVAFDAGNLKPVAEAVKADWPEVEIIIAAGNDQLKDDNPGITKAKEAARAVGGKMAIPKFQNTDSKPTDFNDLHQAEGLAAVRQQLEEAEDHEAVKQRNIPVVISASDLLKRKFPPRENILSPWLPEQGLCLIHAFRGVGKTHLSTGIACSCATGSTFLKWKSEKPVGVLFIDGEMPAVTLQERIACTLAGMDGNGEADFQIITPDLQEYGIPDLGTIEGQAQIQRVLTDTIKLIIIDNISTVCRSTQKNKGDSWLPVQEWALRMRAQGRSVVMVHHDGKGGQQRGTSRKEDILDTVIQLKHPSGYTADQGALFEVHYRKNRGIYGEDAKPFEAQLWQETEGVFSWKTKMLEDSMLVRVERLLDEGYEQKDIAEELEISKGYVSKLVKKVKANK